MGGCCAVWGGEGYEGYVAAAAAVVVKAVVVEDRLWKMNLEFARVCLDNA